MQTIYIFFIYFLTCLPCLLYAQEYKGVEEVTRFTFQPEANKVLLEMNYASPVITNAEKWKSIEGQKKISEVTLVFTRYPLHISDWITNYDSLLSSRKRALIQLIPELSGSSQTKWTYILQNECKTEAEAKKMFHGAIIRYTIDSVATPTSGKIVHRDALKKPAVMWRELPADFGIKDLVNGKFPFADSIVFKVLNRHPEWKDMLVVNDWTGSMYEFGAQTVVWNQLNQEKKAVKNFVFFNDGDRKKDYRKEPGKTGGIYFCKPGSLEDLITVMNKVMENGYGGDMPENNIEAILTGIRKTKDFSEVVMIADNRSNVRDMSLLPQINTPVRIILCGSYKGGPVIPDYLEIARRTGGSIHTMEEDIENLSDMNNGDTTVILNITYIFRNGRFEKLTAAPYHEVFE
jgi:hypothetical protein